MFAETLNAMLEGELNTHLGYEKYAIAHKQTPRLAVPRDRQGTFEPAVVPKHQTTMPGIEDQGYVQNVVGFPRFLAQSSVLSTTGQGWNMRFVLT
ncbi:MAG: hypothetical protein M0Z36_14040, partial [Thermaerobacter sp.]|nr:hypothetical protein [Thermaerobacter sp.]